jgi:hypothetical protein
MINKINKTYNSELSDTYITLLKDFLIIVCASIEDPNNVNALRDIKSLKFVYPSGNESSIDMQLMLDCIMTII